MKILFQVTKKTRPRSAVEAAMVNQSMKENRPLYDDWTLGSNGMPTNTWLDEVVVEPTFQDIASSDRTNKKNPYYQGGLRKTPKTAKLNQFNNFIRNETGMIGEMADNLTPLGDVTAGIDIARDIDEGDWSQAALGASFFLLPNMFKKFVPKGGMKVGSLSMKYGNPKKQTSGLVEKAIDEDVAMMELPLTHPYGKEQHMPKYWDMEDLTNEYNLGDFQTSRGYTEWVDDEYIINSLKKQADYYEGLADKFRLNKQYDKANEAQEYAWYLRHKAYSGNIPQVPQDVPAGLYNSGAANKIFDQYADAMTRRRDYLYYGLMDRLDNGQNLAIKNPNDFSFLIGQQGESGIFKPSHFAPETNRGGVELVKNTFNSSTPVLFAVTDDLSPMLSKVGYSKIGQMPQFFDGEMHMKDLMANRSLRLEDLINELNARKEMYGDWFTDHDADEIYGQFIDEVKKGNVPTYQTNQGTFFVNPWGYKKGGLLKRRKI